MYFTGCIQLTSSKAQGSLRLRENEARTQHVGGLLAHLDGAPRGIAGRLQSAHIACGVGREVHLERECVLVEVEVHGGEVEHGGLVDVDVEAVVGLHLQGGLQSGVGETLPGPSAGEVGVVVQTAHLGEAALGVVELLCVVVAWNPPCRVVAGEAELRQLVGEPEGDEGVVDSPSAIQINGYLGGEFIAESQPVVVYSKAYHHHCRLVDAFALMVQIVILAQVHLHFVVVVAYVRFFAPHGMPDFVHAVELYVPDSKTAGEVALAPLQCEAHARIEHHGLAVAVEAVGDVTVVAGAVPEFEGHLQPSVGTLQGLQGGRLVGPKRGFCQHQREKK